MQKILYVDDEVPNLTVFKAMFKNTFSVLVCDDAVRALELVAEEPIAVVLSDQRMPTMSGNELLARVRDIDPQIVRIAITAFADIAPILKAINEGLVARYIVKPWDETELTQILNWALDVYSTGKPDGGTMKRIIETERLATLGSISAALAHEMIQPLSLLINNTEYLDSVVEKIAKRCDPPNEGERSAVAEFSQVNNEQKEAAQMLLSLIRNSQNLTSSNPLTDAKCEPVESVAFAVRICSALRRDIPVTYFGPKECGIVALGKAQLAQIAVNLIRNAVQGVAATQDEKGQIDVRVSSDGAQFVLEVVDNGIGMPEHVRRLATRPFFTTRANGTGVGLHQCRWLTEQCGGQFVLESREGKGTTVSVRLPLAKPAGLST